MGEGERVGEGGRERKSGYVAFFFSTFGGLRGGWDGWGLVVVGEEWDGKEVRELSD